MTVTKTPAELETMHRIINGCLRVHAPEIAVIGFSGEIAVALHEPSEAAKVRARAPGWDGKSAVFWLTAEGKRALASSREVSDVGISKWLGRKFDPATPVARIYVLTGDDALLMNFSYAGGWSLEPAATAGQLPS